MPCFQRLMVGLTRTGGDAAIIRYAAMLRRCGAVGEVRFVHVLPGGALAPGGQDQSLADLQAAVMGHFSAAPGGQPSCDVLQGPLTDVLLSQAAEHKVDLILVGANRDSTGRRTLLRRLAMKAPCSVWIVPEDAGDSVRRILVPIDFSDHAADTLRVAVSLAPFCGQVECLALHVYFNEAVITYEEYDQVLRGQEQEAYRKFVAPIDCRSIPVRPLFEEGPNVARVIGRVTEREGVDLIVMGTRGRSRSAAILLGSVTEEAIREPASPSSPSSTSARTSPSSKPSSTPASATPASTPTSWVLVR
jgi:sulfate permease, SulP family